MPLSRDEILSQIANASLFGSLGLFVGTGFSKALTNGDAPSFKELLQSVANDLKLAYNFDDGTGFLGKSFPRIALEMSKALIGDEVKSDNSQELLKHALLIFKRAVCNRCDLTAKPKIAALYRALLQTIDIQWVITTNYDFILEDVIPNSIYLLPNQLLNVRSDYVPIYHLHGYIRSPESIVITDADYIGLFSPTEYRQLKLNLLLAESTTLMLGYNLGDVNVQTAIAWSRVFKREQKLLTEPYQSLVIQALYVSGTPVEDPYVGDNGEVIIETNDIAQLLAEVNEVVRLRRREHAGSRELLRSWMDKDKVGKLIADDKATRTQFIETIKRFPRSYDVQALLNLLKYILEPIWDRARENGGFGHYDHFLNILLDILTNLPVRNMHPSLFSYLADQLNSVSYYINPDGIRMLGDSWSATQTWTARKADVPKEMKVLLAEYAESHYSTRLSSLLR